jgi:rod shape-determining protein MreC
MEASRDDFIIAIRSAFLKKQNKQRFSLIGLIFFSIIFLILGRLDFKVIDYVKSSIREVVYRSSFIVSAPENYIKNTYQEITNHFNFYEDYSRVNIELKKAESQILVNSFIVNENKRLRKIIDDYIFNSEEVVAKVLLDKDSPFLRSVVINKGSRDNIKLGMSVLDEKYLVGKVVEVNYLSSRVLLLSDLNSKIPVIIEPGGIQSILSGTGQTEGIIQYLKENYVISKDSVIYTSGSGGLFKAGVPIGKVKISDLSNEKTVDFFSDFTQLKFVKIVYFKKETK